MKTMAIGIAAISLSLATAWGVALGAGANLVAARREGPLSFEMGSWRRARFRQPYQARVGDEGCAADEDWGSHRARPRTQRQDASVRHAALRCARQADISEPTVEPTRLE